MRLSPKYNNKSGIKMMDGLVYLGYLGLFFASFLSSTILPLSSEGVLSLMLALNYDFVACILFASIGNTMGGMTGYYLGKWKKTKGIIKYFGIKKTKIQKWEPWVHKYGNLLAFITWMPFIGDLISIALGYYGTKTINVLVFMFLGKSTRYLVWAIISYQIIEII